MNVTAVIIARGGSVRLPGKNLKYFHGSTLVAHKIKQLKQCKTISHIVVGSDDDKILKEATMWGAYTYKRAPDVCDEVSKPWNAAIHDMASAVKGDTILWAHCTNPCVLPSTYEHAVSRYATQDCDSVIGVTKLQSHIWSYVPEHLDDNTTRERPMPVNFDPYTAPHRPAGVLAPVYYQNGAIFIYDRASMLRDSYVYGFKPALFPMDPDEAIDVDTDDDFRRAELLWPWVQTRGRR